VYDGEGRPLVVPIDATAAELRACGCKPASYRLDAVDADRKPLGVTAFTEVIGTPDEVGDSRNGGDAAVAALARAVEAMQRVQAERERVQAEMFMRLVDRMAPAPAQSPRNVKGMVGEMLELQRAVEKLGGGATCETMPAGDDDAGTSIWESPVVTQLAEHGLPAIADWIWKKLGLTADEMSVLAGGLATSPDAVARQRGRQAPPEGSLDNAANGACVARSDQNGRAENERAEKRSAVADKMTEVFELLTPDEQDRVRAALPTLPADIVAKAQRQLLAVPPAMAVAFLRRTLLRPAAASSSPAAHEAAA